MKGRQFVARLRGRSLGRVAGVGVGDEDGLAAVGSDDGLSLGAESGGGGEVGEGEQHRCNGVE